jgi:hypothetical protein
MGDDDFDLNKLLGRWATKHFGSRGWMVMAGLSLAAILFTQREQVAGAYRFIVNHLPARIPPADPKRFTILVAHLTDDDGGRLERIIRTTLAEVPGVRVLGINDTLDPNENSGLEAGHEKARRWLKASTADVAIWVRRFTQAHRSKQSYFLPDQS